MESFFSRAIVWAVLSNEKAVIIGANNILLAGISRSCSDVFYIGSYDPTSDTFFDAFDNGAEDKDAIYNYFRKIYVTERNKMNHYELPYIVSKDAREAFYIALNK